MKIDKIVLVSGNPGKAREIQRILDIPIETREIDLEEIQEIDLEKVALNKLNQAYSIVKAPVMIDDISLEVEVWNKFPGPLIKWLLKAGDGDAKILLKMLGDEENRNVKARLAIGFHDGESQHVFIGEVDGQIAHDIKGKNGFGWDPIFIPNGESETFAQMDPEKKDSISHRGRALKEFRDFLKKNYEV